MAKPILQSLFEPVNIVFKRFRKNWGWAVKERYEIQLDPRQSDERFMYSALHETLHLGLWDLDEAAVVRIAAMQTDVLTRLGFRRKPEED